MTVCNASETGKLPAKNDRASYTENTYDTTVRPRPSLNVQSNHSLEVSPQITMSAAAEAPTSTTKAVTSNETSSAALKDQQKPAAPLEEDDEFEDFPVEGKQPET